MLATVADVNRVQDPEGGKCKKVTGPTSVETTDSAKVKSSRVLKKHRRAQVTETAR